MKYRIKKYFAVISLNTYMTGMTRTISSTSLTSNHNLFRTISITALLGGTLNIISAIVEFYIRHGKDPFLFFKYIASGFFGNRAYEGRTIMITWGIVFHYMIAFLFTAFLFLIYQKIISLLKNKFIVAVLYGLFIWVVMSFIVVPLSRIAKYPSDLVDALLQEMILICMMGLPVVLMADRYYSRKTGFK